MSDFRPDTSSRYIRFDLTEEETRLALIASPHFLAYLQNKIEAYASALVTTRLEYHADPKQQVQAIIEYERLRNFVAAYEELLSELTTQP